MTALHVNHLPPPDLHVTHGDCPLRDLDAVRSVAEPTQLNLPPPTLDLSRSEWEAVARVARVRDSFAASANTLPQPDLT